MREGWVVGLLLLATPALCHAEPRDGHVNPGNAAYMGPVDPQPPPEPSGDSAETGEGERTDLRELDRRRFSGEPPQESPQHIRQTGCNAECQCRSCCDALGLQFEGPLAAINSHPPNTMFLSPTPDSATITERDYYRLSLDWTSIIVRELDAGVIADYDMEVVRLTSDWHARAGRGEVFAQLPLTYRWKGLQDGIIRTWHGWLGLPNALRDILPDNEYSYVLVSRDGPVLNADPGFGVGDLTVGYKHPLWNSGEGEEAAALRASVKLPTGNSEQAFSSGNVDVSVGALYQRQVTRKLRGYANFDLVFIGKPALDNIGYQDNYVWLIAGEYALSPYTSIVAQVQHHGNPLIIGSIEADKDPHQLSLGLHRRMGADRMWSFGFTEDLRPETGPDITFHSHLKWSF